MCGSIKENDRLLKAYQRIGQTILSTMNLDEILKTLAEQIVTAGILRSLAISLVDSENRYVEQVLSLCVSATGFSWDIEGDFPSYPLDDKDIVAETARTGEMQVAVGWDDRFTLRPEMNREGFNEGHAVFFIPVKQQDRVVAVLATGSLIEEKEEVLHRIELMEPLLDQVAIALAHARLYEKAQKEITERKQAEDLLRQSNERLNLTLDNLPLIAYEIDAEGKWMLSRGKGLERLGRRPEEMIGRSLFEHYRDKPVITEAVQKALEGHPQQIEVEVNDRVWLANYNPVVGRSGKVDRVYGTAIDITERQRAEEKRQQLEQILIQSERMATVGTVAAGIVHNLRGPLTGIQGYGELLQERHPDSSDLEQIIFFAQQMDRMTENILAKSQQKKAPESVDLNVLLTRELDFLEANSLFKHEVEKDVRLAEDLPVLECVYTDFSQVFGNLLRNAVDAMYQRETKRLSIVTGSTVTHIIVEVTDTGCGIPEANIPHLFDPFFTTKPSDGEKGEPGGTGLGLFTVQRLLGEPYGAEIEVESTVDVGTTFRVKIPL